MVLILTPFGALLTLALMFVLGKFALATAWMLIPETAGALASLYALGHLSVLGINAIGARTGQAEVPYPGLNLMDNIGASVGLVYETLDAVRSAFKIDAGPDINPPILVGSAAFFAAFASTMSISGEWTRYTATGHWNPTVPVGFSLFAGLVAAFWAHRHYIYRSPTR